MIKETDVVYLSGRIAGDDNYIERFYDARHYLKNMFSCFILNPASLPQYMTIDMAMVEACDVMVMLDGWNNSNRARREHKRALELDKRIIEYGDLK